VYGGPIFVRSFGNTLVPSDSTLNIWKRRWISACICWEVVIRMLLSSQTCSLLMVELVKSWHPFIPFTLQESANHHKDNLTSLLWQHMFYHGIMANAIYNKVKEVKLRMFTYVDPIWKQKPTSHISCIIVAVYDPLYLYDACNDQYVLVTIRAKAH